jgi:hypothetical protein
MYMRLVESYQRLPRGLWSKVSELVDWCDASEKEEETSWTWK